VTGSDAGAAVGASVIVMKHDAVLLTLRTRAPFANVWSFPGGRIEPGETAEVAARRELFEETGIAAGPLLPLGTFRPNAADPSLVIEVFAARWSAGEPRAGDDAADARFVPLAATGNLTLTPGASGWIAHAVLALHPSRLFEAP
jgi:8-oxo-dGTP diphosphatase